MTRRALAAPLLVLGIVTLTGCTSSGTGAATVNGSPVFTETFASDAPSDTSTVAPPNTETVTATPSTSTSTSKPPVNKKDCRLDELTVRALTGSGAQQQEFAVVTFTNIGTRTCTMFGFPGISLRRHGALLGSPASRTPTTPHTVTLKPGDQAEAAITDFSACNANTSDMVRIYPPNSTEFADRPLVLRGCRIVVDPVVLSE